MFLPFRHRGWPWEILSTRQPTPIRAWAKRRAWLYARLLTATSIFATVLALSPRALGREIPIPNGSFESPAVSFVSTQVDAWEKTPKPELYEETGGFLWTQLTGIFKNTSLGSPDRIENCDGAQALWLFAVPEVGLLMESFPDPGSAPDVSPSPLAMFRVGKGYTLSLGVIGMGGGMSNGVPLQITLFYRNPGGSVIPVSTLTVSNLPSLFGNRTQLVPFQVEVPTVRMEDPWANRPLGIRLLSTVSPELQGGYWDLDRVQLHELSPPILTATRPSQGSVSLRLESDPGSIVELSSSTSLSAMGVNWTPWLRVTNTTGVITLPVVSEEAASRFFRATQVSNP